MLRVILRWTGLPGGDAVNVFHFNGDTVAQAQAAADAIDSAVLAGVGGIKSGIAARVDELVSVIEPETGTLVNTRVIVTAPVLGTSAEEVLPQNVMMLLRWRTTGIVRGRRVVGKTFLPGWSLGATENGEVAAAFIPAIAANWNDLIAAGVCVWSRPKAAGVGSSHTALSVDVWNEWAQLGRRRS